jgi:hypothetical protein
MAELLAKALRAGLISIRPEPPSAGDHTDSRGPEIGETAGEGTPENVYSRLLDGAPSVSYNVPILRFTRLVRALPEVRETNMANPFRTGRHLPARTPHEAPGYPRAAEHALCAPSADVRERNNALAIALGLSAVGSTMLNRYGIEWIVDGHVHVPTPSTVARWRDGLADEPDDLYPAVIPQNLSPRLMRFLGSVDRCTRKTFILLDTTPELRPNAAPGAHSLDTIASPGANMVFVDAARLHETFLAHEFGHAWVQYVEQGEDERVLDDVSDPHRLHQVCFVQSFVLDLKVNDVIRRHGFDMSPIDTDMAAGIASLLRALELGYEPANSREEVFMALLLASHCLHQVAGPPHALVDSRNRQEALVRVRPLREPLARLAAGFVNAVCEHGYQDGPSIRKSIDACLLLAFEFTGDGINLCADLVLPEVEEPNYDKYPDWLAGAPVQLKVDVGRIMAREEIPDGSRWCLSPGPNGNSVLAFELPDGTRRGDWLLGHRFPSRAPTGVQRLQSLARASAGRPGGRGVPTSAPPRGASGTAPAAWPPIGRRHYMAGLGRFLTSARLAERLAGKAPYAYTLGNPVNYTDPEGLLTQGRPVYDPDPWNTPGVINNNNCWSYACDWKNRTRPPWVAPHSPYKPQPGGDDCITNACSCQSVMACVARHHRLKPRKGRRCPPGTYTVILFVKSHPPCDYHWIRLDNNGLWSEKCGGAPVGSQFGDPYAEGRHKGYDTVCQVYCVSPLGG